MLSTKLKTPLKSRTLSPGQHLLSPNNDEFERAQARAARAAAQRRKSFVNLEAQPSKQTPDPEKDVLNKDQIMELLQNCIKLATENKINQRNTWELRLIDHISEIVNSEEGEDAETNFQKASCTLEAGVKIYAYRVDSVHSETFKILGGLNRTAADQQVDADSAAGQDDERIEEENGGRNKENPKISSSSATLESYEALNVKKFDVAFTVDPLFNQMSAQFDEGGAKGLLLNTLSVYSGCKLIFDSNEVPSKCFDADREKEHLNETGVIDLSFMKDCIEKLSEDMKVETEISPTLQHIVNMLCDPYRASAQLEEATETRDVEDIAVHDDGDDMCDDEGLGNVYDGYAPDSCDDATERAHNISVGVMNEGSATWDGNIGVQEGEDEESSGIYEIAADVHDGKHLVDWITTGLDSRSDCWAGPDHWKYKRAPDAHTIPEQPTKSVTKKKPKGEKFTIDFLYPSEVDVANFAPAVDQKSIMMPQNNALVCTLLPEDCHYQPEDLVRLFIQPSVMCVNQMGNMKLGLKKASSTKNHDLAGTGWGGADMDDGSAVDGWADEDASSDVCYVDTGDMIAQPRKVKKIEVDYDRTSKQIDVRILKENLWESIQEASAFSKQGDFEDGVSFKSLVGRVPKMYGAGVPSDISVHLCFICLLHLANEHNLHIQDCSTLDELVIHNISADVGTIAD